MRIFPSDSTSLLRGAALAALLLLPGIGVEAQERTVVSKTVTFGSAEAAIDLELSRGVTVDISFEGGEVTIDGEIVGSYTPGDALESAWRSLLGVAVALDDGPLSTALVGWVPPAGLSGESARIAARIDEALEAAIAAPLDEVRAEPVAEAVDAPAAEADASAETETVVIPQNLAEARIGERLEDGVSGRTIGSLLLRLDRLAGLSEGVLDFESDREVRVVVGEDVRIESGTELSHPLFVVDGDVEIAGVLSSELLVLDGEVLLLEDGIVNGRIQLADAAFENRGGSLLGNVVNVDIESEDARDVIRDEVRSIARGERHSDAPIFISGPRAFIGNVGDAIGGVFSNLLTILVFGIGGAAAVIFASANLDAIAESSRRAPGRSFTVGLAGSFLTLPAYILGIVALAISIIGIPGLLAWVPFFPVAVVLAMWMGYVAVARNIGIWVSRQRFPGLGWVRITNTTTLIFGGLVVLAAPWIAASILEIFGGWFSGIRTFLHVSGIVMNAIVALIGFGAFLTTRAGRKPEYWTADDLFSEPAPRRRRSARGGFDAEGFEARTAREGETPRESAPETPTSTPETESTSGSTASEGSSESTDASDAEPETEKETTARSEAKPTSDDASAPADGVDDGEEKKSDG